MERNPNSERYAARWFSERAFGSLKQIGTGKWDFSDSLLLYTSGSDEGYDELQAEDTPYHRLVTAPERAYLESIAAKVAEELPQEIEYIDLGPGTEHKEQFFFDALKNRGVSFTYRPVDINKRYLQLADEYASAQGIETDGLQASFEELQEQLGNAQTPRLVSIGLTYSNYAPPDVLQLLKGIAGREGYAFINSQLRERVDMNELVRIYQQDASDFIASKMQLLGLQSGEDYDNLITDDGIRVWCTIRRPNARLMEKGVRPDDTFMIFQSLRPTRESLERDVASTFPKYTIFDTHSSFVATLLKPD